MATTDFPEIVRVRAQARFVRFSARKARLVLDQVRGKSLRKAEATLLFSPKFASNEVLSLLRSAAANAREQHSIPADELVIDSCFADVSKTLFRFQPRARGRAGKIRKRSCHITLVLRHEPQAGSATSKAAATAVAEAPKKTSAAQATIETESKRPRTRKAVEKPAAATQPAETVAEPSKPAARKPAAKKPVAAKPTAAKPVAAKPVAAKKPAAKPAAAADVATAEKPKRARAKKEPTAEPKAAPDKVEEA